MTPPFTGPVEADESAFGGLEKNKPVAKRQHAGRGMVGKTIVTSVKGRAANRVGAAGVLVLTDESPAYRPLPYHQTVNHSVGQWIDGQTHTNGLESFWAV